jgi:hypothetical protein
MNQLTDFDLSQIVYRVTGQFYGFAVASGYFMEMQAEEVYQLMPHTVDNGFFDWYCLERVDHQFFETKQECTLQFLKYWYIWKNKWQTQ